MAVIIEIRNRFGIVLVGMIAFAIIAFLLMDALSSNSSLLQSRSTTAGAINGQEISIQDFEKKVQEALDNYKMNNQDASLDEQTVFAIRQQTWNQYVNDVLLQGQYEELGVQVTSEELYDMICTNPHPAVIQSFSNPQTGEYDCQQVMMFIQRLDEDDPNMSGAEKRMRWMGFERFLKTDRLQSKYNNLITKAIYVPEWQAKATYNTTQTQVDLDFVYVPYTQLEDGDVNFSDADLQAYLNANKGKYQQEEARTIEYISFDVVPSAADTAKAQAWLTEKIADFAKTEDDSIFVKLYSDMPYDPTYKSREQLTSSMTDTLFVVEAGTIVGPYMEEGAFVAAKLLDRKMIADSVKARHILLEVTAQADLQLKRDQADSLKIAIEGGADFAQKAMQYSDDMESKFAGGELGWVKPGEQFSTINNALFYQHGQGDVFIVPSDRGYHVIQIQEATPTTEAVKVGFLARNVTASSETERAVFAQAGRLSVDTKTAAAFKAAGENHNIRVAEGVQKNDNTVFGLGNSREVVKWAYQAEKGAVSEVFSLDNHFVIAHLAGVKEKGLTPLEDVRTEIEQAVIKEKKAAKLKEQMGAGGDLNAMASKFNTTVRNASGLTFSNTFLTGAGNEPAVVGYALTLEQGATSKPLAGSNGVFVVKVTSKVNPSELPNYASEQRQISQNKVMSAPQNVLEALKSSSDIEDQRYLFY